MEEQAQVDDDPLVGQSVGNYVVRSKLGEGGMGAVYLAEHPLIGKRVALKVLHPELTSKEEVKDRFFHEAKAVNDIQHPNIVDIVDFGEVKGQHPKDTMVYFIMEFLDGRALTEVIRNDAPVPEMRVRHLAMQIGDCLAASHKAGIVHRDLKPDNIMLVAKRHDPDFVKVLDFGIAKLTGDGHQSRKTRTGIVMGTPAYMSPEQCEGKGLIDHRTDVYALGIVIYEMLTGRVPFQGEGYGEVLVQHLTQQPASPSSITPSIPPSLEVVVLKALQKSRDDRYPSMAEFVRALHDPDAYVQSHGGLEGFLGADLEEDEDAGTLRMYSRPGSVLPTPAPSYGTPAPSHHSPYGQQMTPPPGMVNTPPPGAMRTPPPGAMHSPPPGAMHSPPPGAMRTPYPGQAVPTPMGQHPSQAYSQPVTWPQPAKKSKAPLFALLGLLVVGAGVALAVTLAGGGDGGETAAATPEQVESQTEQKPAGEVGDEGEGEGDEPEAKSAKDEPEQAKPDPEPVPDLPFEREIRFTTTPKGASIYLGDKLEGETPKTIKIPDGDQQVTVRLVLAGHQEATKTFKPNRDLAFDVDLKELRRRRSGSRSSSTKKKTGAKTRTTSGTTTKKSDILRPSIGTKKKKKKYDSTGVLRPTIP